MTHAEKNRRRFALLDRLAELERCPACSAGPYCGEHPKALLQALLREAARLFSAGA